MQETLVLFLGQEDPLEEGTAIYSSILAWRIPMNRGAWRAIVYRVTVRRYSSDLACSHTYAYCLWNVFSHLMIQGTP